VLGWQMNPPSKISFSAARKEIFSEVRHMSNAVLVGEREFNKRSDEARVIRYLEIDDLDKCLDGIMKGIEQLEDRVEEIEHRLQRHVNQLHDTAHRI